jgi:hypothetical protein
MGMGMPHDAERVGQLRNMLREARKRKLSGGLATPTLSSALAALNRRRFFMGQVASCGTPFWRDRFLRDGRQRYRRVLVDERDFFANDFIRHRFAGASSRSQKTKCCCILRLKSQPRRTACDGKPLKHRTASDESLHCNVL